MLIVQWSGIGLTFTVGITKLAWLSINFVAEKNSVAPIGVMKDWSRIILLIIACMLHMASKN